MIWSASISGRALYIHWLAAVIVSIAILAIASTWAIPAAWGIAGLLAPWIWVGTLWTYYRLSTHYCLTSQRFIHEAGIVYRTKDRIEVIDIDDVRIEQTLIDRLLQIGAVIIFSSDQTHPEIELLGIRDPLTVASMIDQARRTERTQRALHVEGV